MSDALKPCPFCGCAELKIMGDDHQSFLGGYHVYCHNPNCQAAGRHSGCREKAIAAWNRRPKLQCLETERDALMDDAERYRWASEHLVLTGVMRFGVPHPMQNKAGWDAAIDAARAAGGEA